ncbi:MAG: hypothetical protein FWD69_19625 [Polyangiaceae bacterium]|nr:hypothetical protein [Polyangiaceae bacterium]
MAQVVELFSTLLKRRLDEPLWDVRSFTGNGLDGDALTRLLHEVEPCLVLQRLPDNEDNPDDADRPQHDLMLAFGPAGEAAGMTKRVVPVLQCQVHYIVVHLCGSKFIPSEQVDPEDAACPFYRSCTLPLRVDHADVCKCSPWMIYERSQKETCWYGAAVAGTLGTTRIAPDPAGIPDERASEGK